MNKFNHKITPRKLASFSTGKLRQLFVLDNQPPLNTPVKVNGRTIVFTHRGKTFPISYSTAKRFGHAFLNHVGQEAAYFYYR